MIVCCFTEHFFEFLNCVHAARFAVQHHVAVGANGDEVVDRIDHIAFANFADGLFVVDFDLSGEFLTECQTEIKAAHRAGGTMHGNAARTGLRIALVTIGQDLLLRTFDIEFFRQVRVVHQLLLAVRKRANLSRRIFFPCD